MATTKNPFTEKDDIRLVKFLAAHKPEPKGRLGNAIYQQLHENADNKWPWAKSHTWQSWRERYKKNQNAFDRKIRRYQKRQGQTEETDSDVEEGPSTRTQKPKQAYKKKTLFTDSDDEHLAEFLATRSSDMGRLGSSLYKVLEAEAETLPGVKRHSWQSWRDHYKENQEKIKGLIAGYESRKRVKKEKIAAVLVQKRHAESSVQPPQASTSNSIAKEQQTVRSSEALQASGSNTKGKERQGSAFTPTPPTAPEVSASNSRAKEKQKDDEAQHDQSTHIEMPQERAAGPAKNQRVRSTTPAPVPQAPPNGKGKQKEIAPSASRVQQTPMSVSRREVSIPPIAIKSQQESDVDMHSLFGSDDEEVDELEDSQSHNISKVAPQAKPLPLPKKKDLPPERVLVPNSSQLAPAPSPEQPPPSAQPLRRKAPIPKPRLSKKDENIFVSSDAEQSPSPPRPVKSSPYKPYAEAPKLVEGPYRSQLKRVRSRVESDSDEAPPKRARLNPESDHKPKKAEKAPVEERFSQKQTKENINPEVAGTPAVRKGVAHLHHARKTASQGAPVARAPAPTHAPVAVMTPQSVVSPHLAQPQPSVPHREVPENAIASSSRVKLSDIPSPRKETPVAPTATPSSATSSQLPAPEPIAASLSSPKDSVPRPQTRNALETVRRGASPRRNSGVVISLGGRSEVDFFNAPLHISSIGSNKGKEREYVLDVQPPHIDLRRETLNRRRSQIHPVSKVARSNSRASSASNLTTSERSSRRGSVGVEPRQARMSVASEDAVSALLEWMAPLVDMAAEYKVADSVVVRLFQRFLSMEKTEVVLFALACDLTEEDGLKAYDKKKTVPRAKEALALFARSKKIFEEDVSSGSGEEEMPSGLVLRSQVSSASASAVKVERRENGTGAQVQAPSTKRRRSRPSLIIRRIPSDQDDVMSDYVPPKNSRAGQYARLQKQGRLVEAKEREMNRILITETQTQYVPVRMHSPTVSPTPHGRLQEQDVSQVMMDVDAMRIDEHHEEEPDHDAAQDSKDMQEEVDDSNEDVFVEAEEESQRDDVMMMEGSDDEDLVAEAGDISDVHIVDDDEEGGEEIGRHASVEQPEEGGEEDQVNEGAIAGDEQEEQDGGDEADSEDGEEGEQYDEGDNGIFGSRESDDGHGEQYYHEEHGTSPTNSDFDPEENEEPPPSFNEPEDHPNHDLPEQTELAQNTDIVDEDDDDIYMPESLEMPYPGQLQRHADSESQEVPEAEPEAGEAPSQSSTSHMQPSSLPSLLTFGSGGPDKNPALADVAKTHRQLALNATAENHQELNGFEEKHSDKSDLMRLWSIKWAKALIQHNVTDIE